MSDILDQMLQGIDWVTPRAGAHDNNYRADYDIRLSIHHKNKNTASLFAYFPKRSVAYKYQGVKMSQIKGAIDDDAIIWFYFSDNANGLYKMTKINNAKVCQFTIPLESANAFLARWDTGAQYKLHHAQDQYYYIMANPEV